MIQKRAGLKGFGLFAAQDIKAGQFIIEYVGEVLEEEEYLRRKEFYQEVGQRHYYFMNIGNGEVIDACRKVWG
jgi:histone-lysine N-methyltransferase SETD2